MFEIVRVHSSGNIFSEEDKFNLFNLVDLPLEFKILRVALNSDVDMNVLGYSDDYLKSLLFRNGNIKCDIALTDYLERSDISLQLNDFLKSNPSIKKVRLKKLLVGDNGEIIPMPSYGYHVINDNDNFFYSGDTCVISDIILEKFKSKKIKIMYHEVATDGYKSHIQLDDLAKLIEFEDRKRVVCMHMGDNVDVSKIKKLGFESVR